MALRPFDATPFDSAIFDTGSVPTHRRHGDYKQNKYHLARPGGVNPSR